MRLVQRKAEALHGVSQRADLRRGGGAWLRLRLHWLRLRRDASVPAAISAAISTATVPAPAAPGTATTIATATFAGTTAGRHGPATGGREQVPSDLRKQLLRLLRRDSRIDL